MLFIHLDCSVVSLELSALSLWCSKSYSNTFEKTQHQCLLRKIMNRSLKITYRPWREPEQIKEQFIQKKSRMPVSLSLSVPGDCFDLSSTDISFKDVCLLSDVTSPDLLCVLCSVSERFCNFVFLPFTRQFSSRPWRR